MGQIGHRFVLRNNPTVDAQFSAQYTAALALITGRPNIKSFTPAEIVGQKNIRRLADKIIVAEIDEDNPGLVPVEIEISLPDGTEFHERVTTISGSPDRPLTKSELLTKFDDCLDHAIIPVDRSRRASIIQILDQFDSCDDVGLLFSKLS